MNDIQDIWLNLMGLRIHCLSAGASGAALLLLHGGGADSAKLSWGGVIGALAEDQRVIAVDLPGYGESDRPDVPYTTRYYLDFIAALLDALQLTRTGLMGLSMGGALALGTALERPERVDRLVLVDSYGLQRHVVMHSLSWLLVKTPGMMEATWALIRRSRSLAAASLSNIFYHMTSVPAELIDDVCADALKPHAGRAFTAYQRAEMQWNSLRTIYLDRLGEIQVPTLIVHGRQDKAVPLACAEEAHRRIAGSQLVVLDNAGHWSQREKPQEFLNAVRKFDEMFYSL